MLSPFTDETSNHPGDELAIVKADVISTLQDYGLIPDFLSWEFTVVSAQNETIPSEMYPFPVRVNKGSMKQSPLLTRVITDAIEPFVECPEDQLLESVRFLTWATKSRRGETEIKDWRREQVTSRDYFNYLESDPSLEASLFVYFPYRAPIQASFTLRHSLDYNLYAKHTASRELLLPPNSDIVRSLLRWADVNGFPESIGFNKKWVRIRK